ncbi:hypothetical protein M2333_002196 [Sphingobium sp. B11D3B]|uniref:Pr6Pr family membrane protein n=1 Tax=Sphingobium sp. B11D3B TaxID=2940575 RepID=UPI0016111911|nr:Pr6Pr family membrane protein [Sphingobium sp. B11D3B]MCW2362948.1 hypothetical protein [Sphingobium sp. B10D3B]MCW2389150.1 hypothetical protein [Sphingobium sp. B11D3B]
MRSPTKTLSMSARIAALLVGLIAFAGLSIRFAVSLETTGSPQAAAWTMLRFFTVIGNLLSCVVLFGVALGAKAPSHPRRLAGVMLAMGLIGIVYAVLLRATESLSGPAETSNLLLHYIAPPAVALYWLVFVPKGRLVYADTLRWALLPLAYLAYAIGRAQFDGRYPYPFLDVSRHGWAQVGVTVGLIALGFMLVGAVVVWIDRRLG